MQLEIANPNSYYNIQPQQKTSLHKLFMTYEDHQFYGLNKYPGYITLREK